MARLRFLPEARVDVLAARDWYERQARGLGAEFARAVDAALAIVARSPEAFTRIDGERRRVLLRRFPYQLVYRLTGDGVLVLACFRQRRDPEQFTARR